MHVAALLQSGQAPKGHFSARLLISSQAIADLSGNPLAFSNICVAPLLARNRCIRGVSEESGMILAFAACTASFFLRSHDLLTRT